MALLSGFDRIESSNNTFSDWLNKTNEMIDLFRDNAVTANSSGANTDGNVRINGEFVSNTLIAHDELRGGDLFFSEQLNVVSNTVFTSNADFVRIENDLFVEGDTQVSSNLTVNTDSLFVGDVEVQSTVEFTEGDTRLVFSGANQDFVSETSNTYASIRTTDDGSLLFNADKTGVSNNQSIIELQANTLTLAQFAEGGDVAFYSANGSEQRLYWDATNITLGVNTASPQDNVALDVVGNTHTTDLFVEDELTANIVTIDSELRGSADLTISSNVVFQSNAVAESNLSVEGTLSISTANLDYLLVPDNYNDLIPNQPSGRLLGNTSNRWDGFFDTGDFSGDVDVDGTITTDTLVVTNSAALPSTLTFTGDTSFEDITVTGVASFANLEVQSLTTNSAGLIGTGGTVTTTSPTVIDQFDKTVSRGFKYVIHGENNDATSAYAIEINCSHNGTDVFFTRFGEVSNNFDAVIVPQVNGGNIELIATCSSASVSNTHSFNMVRIETR